MFWIVESLASLGVRQPSEIRLFLVAVGGIDYEVFHTWLQFLWKSVEIMWIVSICCVRKARLGAFRGIFRGSGLFLFFGAE